jgi:hypothetical protein
MNIKIRAYLSSTDTDTSLRYVDGFRKVLESYGVTKVTSATHDWVYDDHTYVIIVTSEDDEKIFGGCRVQVRNTTLPLPMEEAISRVDPSIHRYMDSFGDAKIAEFSGLFNSIEVAGYGIGSMYLGRVGVAICNQVGVDHLLGLCSPTTYRNCARVGFETLRDIGNGGRFHYPKEGLIATSVIIKDIHGLPNAQAVEREKIYHLRDMPNHKATDAGPKGDMSITYVTEIESVTA